MVYLQEPASEPGTRGIIKGSVWDICRSIGCPATAARIYSGHFLEKCIIINGI